uniref:Embigin n=1 Tax=Leptobrachium leishanense TaxID=445787 RepID=A0A8C5P8U5_9ANUR
MQQGILDPDATDYPLQRNDESMSNYTMMKQRISLHGLAPKIIKRNIILDSPTLVKLECELLIDANDLQMNAVTWTHENESISKNKYIHNITENKWLTSYEFVATERNTIGTYACIFNFTKEVRAEFHIKAPTVKGENKPLVSYVKDSIVMKCDSSIYKPVNWIWYRANGIELEPLNLSLISLKYDLCHKNANETKLRILELSEEDSGTYICKAMFPFGEQEGRAQLNVLSYMVPLKIFFAIAAEVVILVSLIILYEMKTKKNRCEEDVIKDTEEESTNLKSEDSKNPEMSTTRQRKSDEDLCNS